MPRPQRAPIALVRAVVATAILAAGLFGLAQGVVATPALLADGSEIVVTDRDGDHLLGYGRVEGGVLRLSFAERGDDGLAVMVIDPEGRLSTLVGRFAAGALHVRLAGASQDVTLASWLSDRGVRLTLDPAASRDDHRGDDHDEGRDDDDDGDDDDRDEAPADGPSDDGDDGVDDADDADDDADDDAGDDDAGDDADDGDGDRDDADDADDDPGDEDDEADADDG